MTAYETLEASGIKFKSWQGAAKYLQQKGFSKAKATKAAKNWFSNQTPPAPTPTPEPTPTPPSGLALLRHDPCTNPDPDPLWNAIDAAADSRHQHVTAGGPNVGPFRRLTVQDGDDFWGERCELAYNTWRRNTDGSLGAPWSTFFIYEEGQRRVTEFWMRLPSNFPIATNSWQVVAQMKQAGPSNGSGGTPVIALEARQGQWQLQSYGTGTPKWSAPATLNLWTKFVIDAIYSTDPAKGKISVNGSAPISMQTLKPEIYPGDKGIPAGEGIPGHLRLGIYHDPNIPGTSVDIADIKVLG